MTRDVGRFPGPSRSTGALPAEVAECARLGERLSRIPRTERDLAWYVMAEHVGDLGALASARLRVSGTAGRDADSWERSPDGWERPRLGCDADDWDHPRASPSRWMPRRR